MGVFADRESEQQAVENMIHLLLKYYFAKRFKMVCLFLIDFIDCNSIL